jgi:hypothetical protein
MSLEASLHTLFDSVLVVELVQSPVQICFLLNIPVLSRDIGITFVPSRVMPRDGCKVKSSSMSWRRIRWPECIQRSMRWVDCAVYEIHACTFGDGKHLRQVLVKDVALGNTVLIAFHVLTKPAVHIIDIGIEHSPLDTLWQSVAKKKVKGYLGFRFAHNK